MLPSGNAPLVNLQLDCPQTGWGFAPIVSLDFHHGPLTLAARYEFRTKIQTENDTKELIIGTMGQDTDVKALAGKLGNTATVAALSQTELGKMAQKVKSYLPEETTRYDMPSLLSVALGYEITPKLRATGEFHFFDDKNAKMANDRQKTLSHGTHEFLAGVEYDINKKFTISCGGQRTDYGITEEYQQNTSFACDSWSIGMGGAWNINEKMRLNASYFISIYSDNKKTTSYGIETYSRTNNVIGVGLDYKF
jgi:long-chain fatty acid transport protein